MSQAYRSRITTFVEEPMNGVRGFWIGWRSPKGSTAFADTVAAIKRLPLAWRKFDSDEKLWWVAAAALPELADDLEDLATYESQWKRLGSGRREAPPPPKSPAIPVDVAAAFTTLHLTTDAPRVLVEAARRVYAQMHHPDHGGDLATMKRYNIAADVALEWVKAHAA